MKRRAFTLAEVLIALIILGVIAALTLPSLMKLNEQASIGTKLSSIQYTLEEGLGRIMLDNPTKVLKDLTLSTELPKYLIVTAYDSNTLKNGATFAFAEGSGTVPVGTVLQNVKIDLNGDNLPNKEGIDQFEFALSSRGMAVPQKCAGWIAENNWKVPKDYDETTCKDWPDIEPSTPSDPCDACGENQTCVDGVCVDIEPSTPSDPCDACGENQTCVDGVCVDNVVDPCDGVVCSGNTQCVNGGCVCKSCPANKPIQDPATCECRSEEVECCDGTCYEITSQANELAICKCASVHGGLASMWAYVNGACTPKCSDGRLVRDRVYCNSSCNGYLDKNGFCSVTPYIPRGFDPVQDIDFWDPSSTPKTYLLNSYLPDFVFYLILENAASYNLAPYLVSVDHTTKLGDSAETYGDFVRGTYNQVLNELASTKFTEVTSTNGSLATIPPGEWGVLTKGYKGRDVFTFDEEAFQQQIISKFNQKVQDKIKSLK